MTNTFATKQERDEHLVRHEQALDSWLAAEGPEGGLKADAEKKRLYAEYFDRLPVLQFSVCPHCSAPYHHTYDPFSLSGLFWGVMPNRVETNCEHACLIRSAYVFNSPTEPVPYGDRSSFGPELPYVIGRILDLDTMRAVISKIEFDSGDILYPIVYFATEPQDEFGLTADWDNDEYKACDVPRDSWDFDLRPWVESGQVGWCEPGDEGLILAEGPSDACPFYGLKGHLGKQFVYHDGDLGRGTVPTRKNRPKPPEGWEEE